VKDGRLAANYSVTVQKCQSDSEQSKRGLEMGKLERERANEIEIKRETNYKA